MVWARRRRPLRVVGVLLRFVLAAGFVLVLIAAGVAYLYARASLPGLEGRAGLPGLAQGVTVVRDSHGVPHIFAASQLDAFRALGYVHAQDRLFQMEMHRRVPAGRLAELVGEPGLPTDRFMRLMNLAALAEAEFAALPPADRQVLVAYADGVNAWLNTRGRIEPPAFAVLFATPEPWRPVDSLLWGKLMALQLSGNYRSDVLRAQMQARLSALQQADLWPRDETEPFTLSGAAPFGNRDGMLHGLFPVASASNSWVVDGRHTTSGKPMLANDPHLGLTMPALWYLARLVTPEQELVGATVPGVPAVLLGRNRHIAWGMTSSEADVQDIFHERIDPDNPDRYLTPDGPVAFTTRDERIHVRGQPEPEIVRVRETRHGPVLSDVSASVQAATPDGHVAALAFTALAGNDTTARGVFALNRARNQADVVAALRLFHAPVMNVAYADTGGRIGFQVAGRLPKRRSGDGRQPADGWSGAFDWTGFVPAAAMPGQVDPGSGRFVNANNRVVDATWPHFFAGDWPHPARAIRIDALLSARPAHGTASFAAIQNDAMSPVAAALLPLLLAELDRDRLDPAAAAAASILEEWPGLMAREQAAPLIFMAWLHTLQTALWGDELGVALTRSFAATRPRAVNRILSGRRVWCDDVDTQTAETCETVVTRSLNQAVAGLMAVYGNDPLDWRWGETHAVTFSHPVLGRIPGLNWLTDVEIETDGGPFTVNRGEVAAAADGLAFPHVHGPGYRAVYDLANPANSRYIISTGQSEHPLSPWYRDLVRPWRDGRYITLTGSAAELTATGAQQLTLQP